MPFHHRLTFRHSRLVMHVTAHDVFDLDRNHDTMDTGNGHALAMVDRVEKDGESELDRVSLEHVRSISMSPQ